MNSLLKILLVLSILTACASNQLPAPQLGQVSQPIYSPLLFGLENGPQGLKCEPPWEGSRCNIPKSRSFKIAFLEATCSDWWKTRVSNVLNWAQVEMAVYGWSLQFVNLTDATYFVGCTTDVSRPIAYFDPFDSSCQDTQFGELCRYQGGELAINVPKMEGRPIWKVATSFQRRKNAHNTIKHEVLHMLGHGHYQGSTGGTKVMAQGYPADLQCPAWNEELQPDSVEWSAIDCYNPGSSTNSLCGD